MESYHRLGAGAGAGRRAGLMEAVAHTASWLVLSSLLVACGSSSAGDGGAVNQDAAVLPEAEEQKVEEQKADVPEAADQGTVAAAAADQAPPAAAEKLPIIVNLAVGEGSGAEGDAGDDTHAAVTARVMERLKAAMPAEDLAEVRTFGFLPAIALSADGALIARLLAMPEVQSIELDRELQPLGDAAGELNFD